MNLEIWKTAWGMLTPREKRMAWVVVAFSVLGGLAQILMIGSVMPFLSFISPVGEGKDGLASLQSMSGVEDRYRFAVLLGGLAIGAILLSSAVLVARGYVIARFTMMRVHAISSRLFASYLDRSYDFFLARNSSDIGKRILSETSEISTSFLQPATELVASGISALFIVVFLFSVEPVGTFFGIAIVAGIYGTIQVLSNRYMRRIGEERVAANQARFLAVSEIFGAIKDVKTHGTEGVYRARFEEASKNTLVAHWKSKVAADSPKYLIQGLFFCVIVGTCLAFIDPESFRQNGQSISEMIPVLGVLALAGQRIVPELQKIYASISKMNYGGAAIMNVHADMGPLADRASGESSPIRMQGGLVFKGVSYRYPGSEAGLSDVSLEILKGQRIGVVGGTGAGKTTLVDLFLGLLQPDAGSVRVDDVDIGDPGARLAWKSRVSYVPQAVFLADSTITHNIAFGVPDCDIDAEKVRRCAIIAQIHDHVSMELPEGYATRVGERGAMLSGGQVQRIGIARALYRDADLIVLDEATSALDQVTERKVMEAIDAMPRNVTVVMIAHRLETLRDCDRLLVMEDGRLVEDGSWAELESRGGRFAKMVSA